MRNVHDLLMAIAGRIKGEIGSEETRLALRDMVSSVTVHPPAADNTIRIEVDGHLRRLIGGDAFPKGSFRGDRVVAEEGVEPPTPGL
jgi:site-specific DNA recombinase